MPDVKATYIANGEAITAEYDFDVLGMEPGDYLVSVYEDMEPGENYSFKSFCEDILEDAPLNIKEVYEVTAREADIAAELTEEGEAYLLEIYQEVNPECDNHE